MHFLTNLFTYVKARFRLRKFCFPLFILISCFFLPFNAFAEEGISPYQTEIYWRAENLSTSVYETAQYLYTPGSWTDFGTNNVGFNVMSLGSFLTYQQVQGTYSAKITYYISTTTPTYTPEILSCGSWSNDVADNSCSIESGTFKDNVFTYVVNYRWSNSSGFIELYLTIDNGLYLIPKDTRFMYQIDSLIFNPSQESIIIGQNQTIINQNQTIINNQTQNTQDIINNQNSNTDKEISSQRVCSTFDFNATAFRGSLNTSGEYVSSSTSNNYVTDYIKIGPNDTIQVLRANTNSSLRQCFYDINKKNISCYGSNLLSKDDYMTIPPNVAFVRFTINKLNNSPFFQVCKTGNQALNDTLTDDNVSGAKDTAGSFFNDFTLEDNGGISSVITMPLQVINGLVTGENSCKELSFSALEKEVSFPSGCILWNNASDTIETLYHTIICGVFGYILLIRLFKDIESLKNPDSSEVSTLDL